MVAAAATSCLAGARVAVDLGRAARRGTRAEEGSHAVSGAGRKEWGRRWEEEEKAWKKK